MDLEKLYNQARKMGINSIFRSGAHLFGIYDSMDLVRLGRKFEKSTGFMRMYYQIRFLRLSTKLRIEIPNFSNIGDIGENFALVHASSVVIHKDARIGNDVVVFKGVSIGAVRGGARVGVPIIED